MNHIWIHNIPEMKWRKSPDAMNQLTCPSNIGSAHWSSLDYLLLLEEVISSKPLIHHFRGFWVSLRNSFPVRRKPTPLAFPHSRDSLEMQSYFGSCVPPSYHFHSWEYPFGFNLGPIRAYYTVTDYFVRHYTFLPLIISGSVWDTFHIVRHSRWKIKSQH